MICADNMRKRGFTLVETVISMAVTLVLLSMIMSLIVAVIENTRKNEHENAVHNDLSITEAQIRNWYNSFGDFEYGERVYEFSAVERSENDEGETVYRAVDGGDLLAVYRAGSATAEGEVLPVATLVFDRDTKILSCSNKYGRFNLKNIDAVSFEKKDEVIKASVYYDGEALPLILLLSNERF